MRNELIAKKFINDCEKINTIPDVLPEPLSEDRYNAHNYNLAFIEFKESIKNCVDENDAAYELALKQLRYRIFDRYDSGPQPSKGTHGV
jgi:hypothetical protein